MKKLSELMIGQSGIIKKIDSEHLNRLMSMGLIPGSKIAFVRAAPIGDPLEFNIKNYELTLRKELCEKVEVDVIE